MEKVPVMEPLALANYIHVKARELPQNTNIDMWELAGLNKALQSIQGKLINNTSNLTNVNKRINKGSKSFKKSWKWSYLSWKKGSYLEIW